MRMLFKQRLFSWFDSYDIYDESGRTLFVVKGQLSWGHCMKIFDAQGHEVGMIKEKIITFVPKFDIYIDGRLAGSIRKNITLFSPKFSIDYNGWSVRGNFIEWDYSINDSHGNQIAYVSKEIFRLTDTYSIDVANDSYALDALMVVLAIDAEKCSRDKNN